MPEPIKQFNVLVSPREETRLPVEVKSFHELADFVLEDYLKMYNTEYTKEGKVAFMEWVLSTQEDNCDTLQTCALPLARAVVSQYELTKGEDMLPLTQKNLKFLIFIIKKTFLNAVGDGIR